MGLRMPCGDDESLDRIGTRELRDRNEIGNGLKLRPLHSSRIIER